MHIVLVWRPSSNPPPNGAPHAAPSHFSVIVAKPVDGSLRFKMPHGREVGFGPVDIVLDWPGRAPPTERGTAAHTFWPMFIVAKRSPISAGAKLLLRQFFRFYGVFGRPFVNRKRFAYAIGPMSSVLSVSVCKTVTSLVYCGLQTAGWIRYW